MASKLLCALAVAAVLVVSVVVADDNDEQLNPQPQPLSPSSLQQQQSAEMYPDQPSMPQVAPAVVDTCGPQGCGQWPQGQPEPWMVVIAVMKGRKLDSKLFTFGTLIGPQLILTSSERLDNIKPEEVRVFMGHNDLSLITRATEHFDVALVSMRKNSQFSMPKVTLLTLVNEVPFQQYPNIRPICFPQVDFPAPSDPQITVRLNPNYRQSGQDLFSVFKIGAIPQNKNSIQNVEQPVMLYTGKEMETSYQTPIGAAAMTQAGQNDFRMVGIEGDYAGVRGEKSMGFLNVNPMTIRMWINENAGGKGICQKSTEEYNSSAADDFESDESDD